MITRDKLIEILATYLKSQEIKDYCPNGLQVEGKLEVHRIICGVTASVALIDTAIEQKADTIIVHHGYFWKGENPRITGMKKQRLQKLLQHNINLLAYHLPLDIHPIIGNNVQLAKVLGIENVQVFSKVQPEGIIYQGQFTHALTMNEVNQLINKQLQRQPLIHQVNNNRIKTVAWCTGGGQSYIDEVANQGIDLFITGEVSEQTIHSANEQQIHFIAAGHHATERYGIRALNEWLAEHYDVSTSFMDLPNPA